MIVELVGKICHPTLHLRHLADFLLRFPGEFRNLHEKEREIFVQLIARLWIHDRVHGQRLFLRQQLEGQDVDGDGRFQIPVRLPPREREQVHLRPIVERTAAHIFQVQHLHLDIDLLA